MNASSSAANTNSRLRQFAFRVAGPRDFAINLAINGTIAWWLFGGREAIPISGSESIFNMLLPMAYIESTLTTFFGLLNGTLRLRKLDSSLETVRRGRWFLTAVGQSVFYGFVALAIAISIRFILRFAFPTAVLSPRSVVILIGLTSGLLGYILHVRAVLASSRM
jgi:hypothetical protein